MRIALVHDWLTGARGGEKVLESLSYLFPDADLYTLVYQPEKTNSIFLKHKIQTSPLQRLPFGKTRYPYFLPLYWELMGAFDLSGYDLIVSSSSACAKWIRNPNRIMHVSYCHSPMRYIWDLYEDYFGEGTPRITRWSAGFFRSYLQRCDLKSNEGVTHFIANSTEVKERIARLYGRDSTVIHPPVDLERFSGPKGPGEYFLVVSALVPYKKIDLAVKACTKRNWPLLIVGRGSEMARLKALAGPSVKFQGWVSDEELPIYYSQAKALLFPGKEDFGIVPVEALAAGCPVIAFGEGGVRDTLVEGETGLFFSRQTEESLEDAAERFLEKPVFDPEALRQRAKPFSRARFIFQAQAYFRKVLGVPAQNSPEL